MGKPYKSVSVPARLQSQFAEGEVHLLDFADVSFSKLVQLLFLQGIALQKHELSEFLARENLKTGNSKYIVIAME